MPLLLPEIIFMTLLFCGCAGIFIWFGMVVYIRKQWLSLLEDILDDGIRFYTLTFLFAGQGVLQYATVFLWSFHAKRYGMLEKRNNVPKHIQKWLIFAFCWFMFSGLLMIASVIMVKIYGL